MTQWFPPEPGTLVAAAIADGLAERGHEVDVLTGFPNYPTGKLHEGYAMQPYRRDQRSDRVTIHRAPLYPSHGGKAAKRVANYLSFAISATWIARRHLKPPDVWLTYSSPATASLPSLLARGRYRAPSFLLIQDLWPDSVTESGILAGRTERFVSPALRAYCNWSYRESAGIGIISPSMRGILTQRGVSPAKIELTSNWVNDNHLLPTLDASDSLRLSLGLPGGRLFMYAGNIGELQGLEPLVRAFARCPQVNLALVGEGIALAALQSVVRQEHIKNVYFIESQPTDRIGKFIAASDVQIVSLKGSPLLRATMPSKVQTAMAAGRPILAHAVGDIADVVVQSGSGLAVAPGDLPGIVSAIQSLGGIDTKDLAEMGSHARRFYEAHFSSTVGLDRLESLLLTDHRFDRAIA